MKYLHTMVRVTNLENSLKFYRDALGLELLRVKEVPQGRYTLAFLAAPGDHEAQIELTYNWDAESYTGGRNFGHVAYAVDDIYATCERLQQHGVTINRPPRDGYMAFVRSPDNISIELLQRGGPLPPKAPWVEVWESPQAIVVPGWVMPCSGPTMWTMPCLPVGRSKKVMPFSAQFLRSALIMASARSSLKGSARSSVGTMWSTVAKVRCG